MANKTRYFILGAAGILTAGLTAGLVASWAGLPTALTQSAGPDDLRLVPPAATLVAYADVRQVMASELRRRLRKVEPNSQDRDEFEAKTGVNIERDIDAVVAAMLPQGDGQTRDSHRPLVIARGRFDQVRIEGLVREHGGEVSEYQGVRLLTHADSKGEEGAMGFIEPGVVALGDAAAVRAAIDAKQSGKSVLSNTEMMRLVAGLDASNAWAVGRFDAIAGTADLPGGLAGKVPSLSWFSAAGHLNGGVSGTFKAEAKDEDAARNFRDMLRGIVAMAKLQAGDKPALKSMMDSLQLGGEGKEIALAFSVPAQVFEALDQLESHKGLRHGDAR